MSSIATIDLGKIKFKWRGAYNPATVYAVDDVVSYTNSSWVCVATSTGNTPQAGSAYWELMALGGNPNDIMTTNGDLLIRGASALERLPIGTSGQTLEVAGGKPSWGAKSVKVLNRVVTNYTGGMTAAPHYRAWIAGMFMDYTPLSASSKITMRAQFSHSDSGVGAITLAHVYRDSDLIRSFNLSGHNYYVANNNHVEHTIDSWGTTSKRYGLMGSKYSSSYNIYWHSSGYTGVDESPSNGNPHSISRAGQFVIEEWLPA